MTTSPDESNEAALPVVVIWSPAGASVTGAVASLGVAGFEDAPVVVVDGSTEERSGQRYRDEPEVLARIAADFPGRPQLLLRAGLQLPAGFAEVLESASALLDEHPAIAFPGNYDPRVDPLADLPDLPDHVAQRIHWASDALAVALDNPPSDCLLLASRLAGGRPAAPGVDQAMLLDDGYVRDPEPKPVPPADPRDVTPAPPHGHLRLRLRRMAETANGPLPIADGRPVTLHITHSWGGGVWQWIEDLISADPDNVHLVLVAMSDSRDHHCGLRLKLCASGPGSGVLRELDLRPAIRSVSIHHPGYRDQLQGIIRRFGISRIVVSSLIGQSLDCLETGLPTVVMLHDFFPLWPLLDRDPLPTLRQAGNDPDRARAAALEALTRPMRFSPADAGFWNEMAAAWTERVLGAHARLAAPTQHVIERVRELAGDRSLEISRIPHGFRPFPGDRARRSAGTSAEGELHLLIPGRLSEGKGLALLEAILPALEGRVRLTALGCGRRALELLGKNGIDVVLDYRRDEMPGLVEALRPHGALLLSTVPETWSYTLSEVRALGLAPIATRLGAFAERIEDGRNGVLVEPEAGAVVAAIEAWRDRPGALAELATEAPPERSLTQMVQDVNALTGREAALRAERRFRSATADEASWSLQAGQAAEALMRAEAAENRCEELATDLQSRTRWAETMERQFRDRSAWAEQLETERRRRERQLSEQAELLELRRKEFEERSAWAEDLEAERARQDRQLSEQAELLERRREEFEERSAWAQDLEAERRRQESSLAEQAAELERQDRQYHELSERFGELIDDYGRRHAELEQARASMLRMVEQHDRLAHRVRATAAQLDAVTDRFEQLQQQHDSLANEHRLLAGQHQELTTQHQDLIAQHQVLRDEHDGMVASRSWRYTKPFRFVRRVATRRRLRQALNPLQWIRMSGVFLHHLRLRGLRGTLELLQMPRQDEPSPDERPGAVYVPEEIASPPEFERADKPLVSVIVPVYNQLKFTAACLQSVSTARTSTSFEVVVVDDASADETWKWLQRCKNVRALRNRKNLGFIGTCNRGARKARGRYLVFLNNDTQVTDDWLDRLIEPFRTYSDTGIVGARLVFGNGQLQEAGGIVFKDGSGWNYGRGDEPGRPEFSFLSEADYVSGACLAIEKSLFESLDGFDRYFSPAYYEDTDLCFRVRQQGLRVLYQPAARVIHFEGVTSGTDETSGAKRYQAVNRDRFFERWRETLAAHPSNPPEFSGTLARRFRYRRFARRALVIDAVTPAPDQDSGSVRMFAMLELLRDIGFQTSFMPQNLHWTGSNSEALQQAGIEVLTAPWVTRTEDWLEQHGDDLDLIVVSRHYVLSPLLQMIRRLCPHARVVFDTVDLHFLREQREAELTGSRAALLAADETRREELALIEATDATLVVSEFERELLSNLAPEARVFVVSNIHSLKSSGKSFDQRRDLVFVGGFQHPPNLDAAEWLMDEILPQVRRSLPDVQLHIIGSKMPDSLRQRQAEGLQIHGFVPDLEPYMTGCRVSVAPLRYGAGVKGKVNQAMSHGLPVVATTCAAEGMYTEHGRDVLLADDTESLARQIVAVYQDRALWERLAANGRANVDRHFSVDAARSALLEVLQQLDLSFEAAQVPAKAAEA